jgi:predicted cupin superfamily sugar epimerase
MSQVPPDSAAAVIARLNLAPHPEGGWYRETWKAAATVAGGRAAGTAILFLLEAGARSHWHRVDADELWLFQAGDPLTLMTAAGADGEGAKVSVRLGADVLAGDTPQHLVATGDWQAAQGPETGGAGWSLVACVVVPGFEFAGFEMAPEGWSPVS